MALPVYCLPSSWLLCRNVTGGFSDYCKFKDNTFRFFGPISEKALDAPDLGMFKMAN